MSQTLEKLCVSYSMLGAVAAALAVIVVVGTAAATMACGGNLSLPRHRFQQEEADASPHSAAAAAAANTQRPFLNSLNSLTLKQAATRGNGGGCGTRYETRRSLSFLRSFVRSTAEGGKMESPSPRRLPSASAHRGNLVKPHYSSNRHRRIRGSAPR